MTRFEIRQIQPQDSLSMASIIRQVLAEFGANRPGFAWADPELDYLHRAYAAENAVYYVVVVDRAVVGGGGIAPFACEYEQICELQKMYLLPQMRGQGMGKALIQQLLTTAQTLNYQGCYLETFDAMKDAIRLYKKAGFRAISTPLGNSGHSSCNLYFLRWFASEMLESDDFRQS
ncbi:MAG: GNAT family N-acetyltransferase [Leptolyngbyaceae cyanobacterium]